MGVVVRQSIQNTISTYLGFGLGAINTLVLYTRILPVSSYGLLSIQLSVATLLLPLFLFGLPNTIIKFYNKNTSAEESARLNAFSLYFPLFFIFLAFTFVLIFKLGVFPFLLQKYAYVAPYSWHILGIGIGMTYFEIGYAQARVVLKTAFGNILKEIFHRLCIALGLLGLYLDGLTLEQFFVFLVGVHFLRALLMYVYLWRYCDISFSFIRPEKLKSYLNYSLFMFLGGTAAVVILEIDKLMIYTFVNIDQVAFYTVAVFMATIVGVPARSMYQITAPITARLLHENDFKGLQSLYKQSSLNLGMAAGGVLLLLAVNLETIYKFIPQAYGGTTVLVLLIGSSKFYDALLGNNNAILFNSPYYKSILRFGIFLAFMTVVLNYFFIPKFGIKGAAIASFLAISLYDTAKVIYVNVKYNMQPFSRGTAYLLIIIISSFALVQWIPNIENRYLSIGINTILTAIIYVGLLYFSKLSETFNGLVNRGKKRLF